ncbi:MAG: beta-ketoacyl-[acyl-carrier-protein] synthase family protein [Chitinophagaceae bacterium]
MSTPVFVAGVGVISAIGNNTAECLYALENELAGIGDISYLDTIYRSRIPVAEVKLSNEELAARACLPSSLSRTALLSLLAAREALHDAAIEDLPKLRTGFVSANTVGGMDKSESFFAEFLSGKDKGRLRDIVHHECGSVTELVADELGVRDYITTISTACSSSANAIFFGARLIKQDIVDVVVAGGADALTKFTLNGFNTLMILDHQYCKPFDENRKGLNLGEGAAYVVLVSERVAASLKIPPYCKLSGYYNANDAYHQTASSPGGTGSLLAMQGALERSGIQASDIDYINLHGTGTQNNDQSEGTAIMKLFGPPYPKMSSTKSFTGHALGASGGLEAVFSALAIKHGIIYPNLRLETPMKDLPFIPEIKFSKGVVVKNVLSNSFGFGGNCTSLILSKN